MKFYSFTVIVSVFIEILAKKHLLKNLWQYFIKYAIIFPKFCRIEVIAGKIM